MKRIIFAFLSALSFALPAQAVDSVTATPGTITIPDRGNALITIRWRATVSVSSPITGSRLTVIGDVGTLFVDGVPVDLSNSQISRTISFTPPTSETVTIIDRIRVSRAAAQRIANGATSTFQRSFTNTGTGSFATGLVNLQTGPNSALGFSEFRLSFDDASTFRTVREDASLTAKLSISSSGRGVLRGVWEVSGPDGQTQFRGIGRETKSLAGNRRTTLQSPSLPTDRNGIYLVRFVPDGRLTSIPLEDNPVIRYTVTGASNGVLVRLLAPQVDASLSPTARFAWDGPDGAIGYRLEFLIPNAAGSGIRIAAKDIPTEAVRLSPLTVAKLAGQKGVTWRVIAYDGEGNPIGQSEQRSLGIE
ncbi:MAG: hypothetical protein AAF198_02920 [Pseudomonadota bacterium]